MSAAIELRDALTIEGLYVETFGCREMPAVVLSAGLGGSSSYWNAQIDDLQREFFIIRYDHRGTGQSSRADLASNYQVADLSDDICLVMDGLGVEAAHILGHAAGGVAGLSLAARLPHRVVTLTIVNAWLKAPRQFRRSMEIRRDIFLAGGANAYLKAQPIFLYPASWIEKNFSRLEKERASHLSSFQNAETLFARMEALKRFDFSHEIGKVTSPTLVIASDDDALVPVSSSVELACAISGSDLKRFCGGGHAVNVTQPDEFNKCVIDFIRRHSSD